MEVYRIVSDLLAGLEPSSFWMVVFTTITLLLVGTSGRFITGVWFNVNGFHFSKLLLQDFRLLEERVALTIIALYNKRQAQFAVVENIFITIFTVLATFVMWLFVIAFLVLPLSPLWLTIILARKLEGLIYSKLYGCERLNSDAVTWLMDSPKNPSVINGFMMFESEFSIERFREVTRKKWTEAVNADGQIKYPMMKRYIHSGLFYYYWRPEENFDMKRHVYEWSTTIYSKQQLPGVISDIMKSPFSIKETKVSPWEQIMVHFIENDVIKTLFLIRMSHTVADGAAIINFFVNNVADEPADMMPVPKIPTSLKLFMKMKGYYYLPLTYAQSLLTPVPSHGLHNVDLHGTKNVAWSEPISLKLIKDIKKKLHVTVNDVLLGCLATTLHQFFKDAGKTPPKEFTAGVPFDTRFSIEEAEELLNKFAVLPVKIPTEVSDVVHNIHEIRNQMNALKVGATNHGSRAGMRLLNFSLPLFICKFLHGIFVTRLSMVLSNVPGPRVPFKFDGTAIEKMMFVPPASGGIGLSMSILSYNETVYITSCCDDALCATSSQLTEGFPQLVASLAENLGITDGNSSD